MGEKEEEEEEERRRRRRRRARPAAFVSWSALYLHQQTADGVYYSNDFQPST